MHSENQNNYTMKHIFLSIQDRLSSISEIKHIDKDWGQLQYEQPPVKFPCVLIDMPNAVFTQRGRGEQMAQAEISITVANINNIRSSASAPNRENAYSTIELMEAIHQKLQIYSERSFYTPLMRTSLRKETSTKDYEVYTMIYTTSFVVPYARETASVNAGLTVTKYTDSDSE